MKLDHFAWASSSLDRAIDDFETWTGVRAAPGGSHPGKGTRNALLSLGPGVYLAMDAPDPRQELISNGAWMAKLDSYFLCVFAVSTENLQEAQRVLASHGIETKISSGERLAPDGRRFAWDFLVAEETRYGIALPHIMSWTTREHPSADSPAGCKLVGFEVKHPEAGALRSLYGDLKLDVPVSHSQSIELELTVEGPKGRFTLPTSDPS